MKKTYYAGVTIFALAMLGIFGVWYAANSGEAPEVEAEPVTIGAAVLESNGLIYIAQEQGYFAGNGLNVTLKTYDTGMAAVTGMLRGETDMAQAAEFALVEKSFGGEKIRVICTTDKGEYIYIIGRKDAGIHNLADLRGKKIGLPRKTVSEYYLSRALLFQGISMQDVTLVNINRSQSLDTILNGDADAIITTQPYVDGIQDSLGTNAVKLPVQSKQPIFAVVITTDSWLTQNPEQAKNFLKALSQAEDFAESNPAAARAIIQKRLNYSDEYMEVAWNEHQYSLTLDESLVTAMEGEARWMIASNMTTQASIPDFRAYIDASYLRVVKPEAINIGG